MNVTLLLPAHNEAENIRKMVTMMLAIYPTWIRHVVVVNDGSTDETANIVESISRKDKRVKLISRAAPHGVGLAIREGIKHVPPESDYILSMDADFIRNIPDLEDFFLEIPKVDGIIGSRYLRRHSLIRYPLLKKFFNRCFHLLVKIFYGVKQKDLTNNFKLYKKEIFKAIPLSENGYAINAETGLYPLIFGYKIKEMPVTWYARDDDMGLSKFKLFGVASGYFRVLFAASRYSNTPIARILRAFPPKAK
jgi:dolichol-phosphate mannosyltransferase